MTYENECDYCGGLGILFEVCDECGGSGYYFGDDGMVKCEKCEGTGVILARTCPSCDGTGVVNFD